MSGKSTAKRKNKQVVSAVIDANILLAALLRDSSTRELLIDRRQRLFAPEHLIMETQRHLLASDRLRKRLHLSEKELTLLFSSLTANITVITQREYTQYLKKAAKLAPHAEDAPYLALALHLNVPLWSNDKGMQRQQTVKVLTTANLLQELS